MATKIRDLAKLLEGTRVRILTGPNAGSTFRVLDGLYKHSQWEASHRLADEHLCRTIIIPLTERRRGVTWEELGNWTPDEEA